MHQPPSAADTSMMSTPPSVQQTYLADGSTSSSLRVMPTSSAGGARGDITIYLYLQYCCEMNVTA
jgi:hypothetical protein